MPNSIQTIQIANDPTLKMNQMPARAVREDTTVGIRRCASQTP